MKKVLSYIFSIAASGYVLALRAQDASSAQLTDERTPGSVITPQHWWYAGGITAAALLILGIIIRRQRKTSRRR